MVAALILVVLAIALSLSPAFNVLYYFNPLTTTTEVKYAINGEDQGTMTLPRTLTNLAPGDVVTVFLESSSNQQDNLLVEVDNAQCVLTINDTPYFSVGNENAYPAFEKEPPHSINIVPLPNMEAGTELRLDYTLSSIADSILIMPYYHGDQNLIAKHILMDNYLALILSLMMLVFGIALAVIGLVLHSRVEMAIVLFWLGLACLSCGSWTFFANDVILLFFSQFSVFYTVSYLGLMFFPIPLTRFCSYYILPNHSRVLEVIFLITCVFFIAALALHVSGVFSFSQMAEYLMIIGPLMLVAFIVFLFSARHKDSAIISPLFIFGMLMFAALALLDTASLYLGILVPTGTFLMVGLFFATAVIVFIIWGYLSDALDVMEKNARLESDLSAINRSLDLQRKYFQDFTQSAEETRRMRHDLRHQLVAIQGLIHDDKNQEALEYIDNLSKSIPSLSEMLLCDNTVVNSLAAYYKAQAEAENILCDIKLVVPAIVGRVPDGDLSIIVGNLFENAIEACMHVDPDKRFIMVRCNVAAKRFTLVIDNSFDGELQVSGTDFYSRKRRGFGVGIASVRSVVSKYDGSMKYETESGVFKTSLYVKTEDTAVKGHKNA